MLAVSLKWRLGVVRRRPKGTEQRLLSGAGGATGEAPSLPLVPMSPSLLLSGCSGCLCDIPPGTWNLGLFPWHLSVAHFSVFFSGAPVSLCSGYFPLSPPHLSLSGPLGVSTSPWYSSLP